MPERPRVVVIGGGFGGLYAVKSLSRAPVQITLVDRRNFHLFQPLLYQVATGTLSVGNIAASLRMTLRHQQNVRVLLGEMTSLNVSERKVLLKDGSLPYDMLVIASGSEPYYFGHHDWRLYAPGLKSIEDATAMRARIMHAFESAEKEPDEAKVREWLTFIIVGAGPTGVELAGALAEVARKTLRDDFRKIHPDRARIILLNGDDRVLHEYPAELSDQAERSLKRLHVEVRNKRFVTALQPDGVILGTGADQERIAARTILWAAGVRASPLGQVLAQAAGAEVVKDGRVKVEPDLTLRDHPEIFVIGDLAFVPWDRDRTLPGVASVAIQEGRYIAGVIKGRLDGKEAAPFRYRHWGSLATIGRNSAVADFGRLRFGGFFAWLLWAVVHLFYIAEFEDRLLVMLQWAYSYFTWKRSDLLITYTRPPAHSVEESHSDQKA